MSRTETAILAGGCFWGMQDLIRNLPGVRSTRVGYSGGDVPNATYHHHGTHAEAIEVVFDPDTIADRSTYDDGKALAVGVDDVFVNGTPVMLKGVRTSARPGKGLKRQ